MCGIAGVASERGLSPDDLAAYDRMSAAMQHRGPDGGGRFPATAVGATGGPLAMGMRRLSIIDLEHGWQPLCNEDGSVYLIANGEIYNFVELRAALESGGHRFRTGSDCEVLLHLYEDRGLEFVNALRGMFAFALWDTRERRLVLGRDRLGEKPLYIYSGPQQLWFASEMKALVAAGCFPLRLDPEALDSYLHFGWIPEPDTAFEGVRKLPPGHLLVIDVDGWRQREYRYWRLEDAPVVHGDAVELLRQELDAVGRIIVRADVPIGVSLSGGFDSSLVAALAQRHSKAPVHAFTVGYTNSPPQDERSDASQVARDLGLTFHSLEISTEEMLDDFPSLALWRDDPIADISGYSYHAVSREARARGCPVLLQGQGADELLWGYNWTLQALHSSLRRRQGRPVGFLEALWQQRPRALVRPEIVRAGYQFAGLLYGWRKLCPSNTVPSERVASYEYSDIYQKGAAAAGSTYTREFSRSLTGRSKSSHTFLGTADPEASLDVQLIALLCRGYLLQNGLAQGDRLTMRNSVELRLPLVDYRLVELIVGVQKQTPRYIQPPKTLLHEAAKDLVPPHVINRPKRGFTPPSDWHPMLRTRYAEQLTAGLLVRENILDHAAAARLGSSQSRFSADSDLFFKYLVFEFWYQGMKSSAAYGGTTARATAAA